MRRRDFIALARGAWSVAPLARDCPIRLAFSLGVSEAGKDTLGHHDPFEFYNTNSRVGSVAHPVLKTVIGYVGRPKSSVPKSSDEAGDRRATSG